MIDMTVKIVVPIACTFHLIDVVVCACEWVVWWVCQTEHSLGWGLGELFPPFSNSTENRPSQGRERERGIHIHTHTTYETSIDISEAIISTSIHLTHIEVAHSSTHTDPI